MFRRAREFGPAVLVPFAWTFVLVAHLEVVSEYTVFVAHVVMGVLLAGFALTGYGDMQEGALRVWWTIIVVGTVVTACGAIGLRLEPSNASLLAVALFGWMVLPAVGFVDTGRRVHAGRWIYALGTAGCLVGAALYAGGLLGALEELRFAGLVLVGVGQTAGILDAAIRY
ncbi:hypothetical protein [Halobiforma nitratireducens]|uniref:Uncharacterized protein n=1 Tax=Halobiforma nitratireducens JCM 10879 TaxID=1227454 RepID=M0MRT2_9EURY|nr:hypothetical protein [Halobiforma nitratireducens]EMA47165.1 hypothetical protein C446_00580 [Halobiforma nitratireducens JCM 10879]